jgi:hypothetical protein
MKRTVAIGGNRNWGKNHEQDQMLYRSPQKLARAAGLAEREHQVVQLQLRGIRI